MSFIVIDDESSQDMPRTSTETSSEKRQTLSSLDTNVLRGPASDSDKHAPLRRPAGSSHKVSSAGKTSKPSKPRATEQRKASSEVEKGEAERTKRSRPKPLGNETDDDDFQPAKSKKIKQKASTGVLITNFFASKPGGKIAEGVGNSDTFGTAATDATHKVTDSGGEVIAVEDVEPKSVELRHGGEISAHFAAKLKPHQVEGVEFMFKHIGAEKPSGCILAHSMGLGKTLQIVALTYSFIQRQRSKGDRGRVLLVVPSTLLQNWSQEFKKWEPASSGTRTKDDSDFATKDKAKESGPGKPVWVQVVSTKTHKTIGERIQALRFWERRADGGALIIGYEMFAQLSTASDKAGKGAASILHAAPHLVVLDEGHRIKNDKAKVARALSMLRTARRIILTGTPLQNNLEEYWCMVDFVRPKLLGTKKRFTEMYAIPIKEGMLADAEPGQIRLAKRRTFCLTKRLAPFVQRKGDEILRAMLPPKEEICLYVRLSDIQHRLYKQLLQHHNSICVRSQEKSGDVDVMLMESKCTEEKRDEEEAKCKHLLGAHAAVQRIVSHPDALFNAVTALDTKERQEAKAKERELAKAQRRAWFESEKAKAAVASATAESEVVQGCNTDDDVATQNTSPVGGEEDKNMTSEVDEEASAEVEKSDAGLASKDEGDEVVPASDVDGVVDLEADGVVDLEAEVPENPEEDGDAEKAQDRSGLQQHDDATGCEGNETDELYTRQEEMKLGLEWARTVFSGDGTGNVDRMRDGSSEYEYQPGVLELSGKMEILIKILAAAVQEGQRVLVFSQYVQTLDVVETLLKSRNKKVPNEERVVHFRLDGNTPISERQGLVNRFNKRSTRVHAFLITTQAGGLGLNLPAASRVVLLDASWNPAKDSQAAVRAFRMGQQSRVFVYRLLTAGTMEQFVYDRQVAKAQLSKQVVDDTNVTRLFTQRDLDALFRLEYHPVPPEDDTQTQPAIAGSARRAMANDTVLTSLLTQPSVRRWVMKVTRHEDATAQDDSEGATLCLKDVRNQTGQAVAGSVVVTARSDDECAELSKEEEEEALKEEERLSNPTSFPPPALPPHSSVSGHGATLLPAPFPTPHPWMYPPGHHTQAGLPPGIQPRHPSSFQVAIVLPPTYLPGKPVEFIFNHRKYQVTPPPGHLPGMTFNVQINS